ncbi:TniQ family protein [Marinobacter salarius]
MHHEEYLSSAARSTLRPIMIRGEGEHIESLTSYIGRLAWHHSVKPSLLIGSLIDPGKSSGFLNHEIATSFNSLTLKTATIVKSVATQAGLAKHLVAAMTFVHLHDQIDNSARGFIRKTKQWCPVCYHDDHSNGGQYDHLAWSLQGVSHCVKHRCKLRDYCQHCLKAQPYLSTKCEVGFCHHCEQSLSESVLSKRADADCKESEVYSSLVLGIVDPTLAETESLESILRQIAYMFSAEGIPRFAEFLKMDRHCVECWMTGETKPALKSVQRVCGKLKVPWVDVLMKRMSASEIIELNKRSRSKIQWARRELDSERELRVVDGEILHDDQPCARKVRSVAAIERIDRYLDQIISGRVKPYSRAKIAATLGVSSGYLESLFGGKVKMISEIYKKYLDDLSVSRAELLKAEIYVSLQMVYEDGEAPSWSNVGAYLSEDLQKRYSMTEMARIRKEAIPDVFSGRYQASVERAKRRLGFVK